MPPRAPHGTPMAFPFPLNRSQILPRGAACTECRRRRVKCDGARPDCTGCTKHQRTCVYGAEDGEVPRLQKKVRELEAELHRRQNLPQSTAPKTQTHSEARSPGIIKRISPSPSHTKHTSILNHPVPVLTPPLLLTPWHPPILGDLEYLSNGLLSWDPDTDMSPTLRSDILTVFELLQPQLSIDLYLPRLRSTVLPLATSDQSHCDPALWNAICLVVVSCYGPDERRLERLFLDRLHYYGFESVSTTCNLEEHIVASVLEVYYLLHVGRVSEAHNRSSTLVRFAIACNLHQILHPADCTHGLLTNHPPRDIFHIAERINIWWSVYIVAQKVAFLSGLPDGCPDFPPEKIETVLPTSYAEVQKVGYAAWPPASQLRDLFHPTSSHLAVGNNHLLLLSVKSIAMFTCTASRASQATKTSFSEYSMLCTISNNLLQGTPHIFNPRGTTAIKTTLVGATLAEGQIITAQQQYNPALLHIHVDLLCAALMLGTKFAQHTTRDGQEQSKDVAFNAATFLAKIASRVTDVSKLYVQFSLGPPMITAIDILVFEIQRYPAHRDIHRLQQAKRSLLDIISFLPRLSGFFPELGARVSTLQRVLASTEILDTTP